MSNTDKQVSTGKSTSEKVSSNVTSIQFELTPADNQRLVNLCGPVNQHFTTRDEG